MGARLQHLGRQLRERRQVVENVDAASMRPDDQVVVTRMHDQIVHRHGGKVAAQPAPGCAAVDRRKQPGLGPYEQQVVVLRVLGDDVDPPGIVRQPVADRPPAAAVVVGRVDVRDDIIEPVTVERGVGAARIGARRDHAAHQRAGIVEAGKTARLARPGLPFVARHLHEPVVGPHPQHARGDR